MQTNNDRLITKKSQIIGFLYNSRTKGVQYIGSAYQYLLMPYIDPAGKQHLLNFKYAGGTDSITYKYLWSPLDEKLLTLFPISMAPNLITFAGLSILLVSHVVFMLPDPHGIPAWKLVMMAVAILLYQHLDNIDGKQARRTKSSSPLGMLFDHGADAVSAFLLALQVLKILNFPFSVQLFAIFICIMNAYFCAMWSQYCIGYFRLGRINPVDEGLPTYALLCLLCTQLDLSGINNFHIIGTYAQEVLYVILVLLIPTDYSLCKNIFKETKRPMSEVWFMTLLYISAGLCCLAVYLRAPTLSAQIFYPFLYSLACMWSRNMILIQLQFIVGQTYRVFNVSTNLLIVCCGVYAVGGEWLPVSGGVYFGAWAVVQALVLLEFVVSSFQEMAVMLDIKVFSLGSRQLKHT